MGNSCMNEWFPAGSNSANQNASCSEEPRIIEEPFDGEKEKPTSRLTSLFGGGSAPTNDKSKEGLATHKGLSSSKVDWRSLIEHCVVFGVPRISNVDFLLPQQAQNKQKNSSNNKTPTELPIRYARIWIEFSQPVQIDSINLICRSTLKKRVRFYIPPGTIEFISCILCLTVTQSQY